MHYHANRTEDGYASGISEAMVDIAGNGYQYGTTSAQPNVHAPMYSSDGFGQMYDPTIHDIVHALRTENALTELFRSNVSRSDSPKFYVTPMPSVMSAFTTTLAKKDSFGEKWLHGPKIWDRNE